MIFRTAQKTLPDDQSSNSRLSNSWPVGCTGPMSSNVQPLGSHLATVPLFTLAATAKRDSRPPPLPAFAPGGRATVWGTEPEFGLREAGQKKLGLCTAVVGAPTWARVVAGEGSRSPVPKWYRGEGHLCRCIIQQWVGREHHMAELMWPEWWEAPRV